MKTINYNEIEATKNPHGVEAKKIHETNYVQAAHICLKSGQKLIKHITPVDVFFYVLEGTGTVEIGDEIKEVSKDTLIVSPSNIPHGWSNNSNFDLRFLVVKTPNPSLSQNRDIDRKIHKTK
jgi:quercetin dioxygenase-like cupin family protein